MSSQQCHSEDLYMHAHTHTHPFNGPLSRTTWVSRYQKVKPIWILLKQETVSGSGISWAICKSAPRSRQTTTPAPHLPSFFNKVINYTTAATAHRCTMLLSQLLDGATCGLAGTDLCQISSELSQLIIAECHLRAQ